MRGQSISYGNPARPDFAGLIDACLVDFGGIDAPQPIGRAIQPERITAGHSKVCRQTWPDHRQQQRCNKSGPSSCEDSRKRNGF
jgi:hypothetical protein